MNELKIRDLDFQFDPDTPYQWNSGNPYWGNFVNYITLIAPAFERYFIKSISAAIPNISSPEKAEAARLFCRQEGMHSKYHMNHFKVLSDQYPGLEDTGKKILKSYEDLFKKESLEFHLAYAAVVELGFGPMARFSVMNRDKLFINSDNKIASFILWHLVEEFEHRNGAIDVYNDIVGSYWFRIKCIPKIVKHLMEINDITQAGLDNNVPSFDFEGTEIVASDVTLFMKDISTKNKSVFFYEMFCSLLPLHKPDNLEQPEWVTRWFQAEESGVDMRTYYSKNQ